MTPGSTHPVPAPRRAAEGALEPDAAALVEAMDGSERTVLLRMIAAAYPEVVHDAAALVARHRAEAAERRRKDARRREHDRRRRRRAGTGNSG